MKESLIFFALLIVVLIGFLQAFIGMDSADDNAVTAIGFISTQMVSLQESQESLSSPILISFFQLNAIMGSPEFDQWDRFAPPFGLILYYIYNFIIIVILLNVLIALYNSAYEDVTDNAIDEYLALFSQKTLQFVRAPDENVFIAPFNLVELFGLVLPFEWWMSDKQYARLNDYVMGVLYSPLLLVTAYLETRTARTVRFNRKRNEADDDTIEEWEQMADEFDVEGSGWGKRVAESAPNVVTDAALVELKELKEEMKELKAMLKALTANGSNGTNGANGANGSEE
jgi:hypothetical protein